MNITLTLRILGALLLFLAIALLFPVPFSLFYQDGAALSFILAAAISAGCGGLLFKKFRSETDLSVREGFAVVTFGWTFFALFGALPFVFSGAIPSYLNAFFETKLGLARARDVVDGTVIRQPKAYPVYDAEYQTHLEVIKCFLSQFTNLQTVGRNGLHRYNNQDHSMLTAMLAVRNVLGENHDVWNVNVERSYHEDFVTEEKSGQANRSPSQRADKVLVDLGT